jgi:preprotein translocase subunit YajC
MDPTILLLVALLAVMVIFMIRNSRKRAKDAEEMKTKLVPGVDLMTSSGIFGTVLSIDEDNNKLVIESTPGTQLTIHRQAIARLIDPNEGVVAEEEPDAEEAAISAADPEFGVRDEAHQAHVEPVTVDETDATKRDQKSND